MHELSIAESILNAIQAELDQRPGTHALKVGVRIGSMAAVDAGSLQFCFDSIVRDSEWEPLQLEIILAPAERLCNRCNEKFVVLDFNPVCPRCKLQVKTRLSFLVFNISQASTPQEVYIGVVMSSKNITTQ